jgi:hypothetical protein
MKQIEKKLSLLSIYISLASALVFYSCLAGQAAAVQTGSGPATLLLPKKDVDDNVEQTSNIDTLVLCPPALRVPLQRWVNYRRQQGYRIQILPPLNSAFGVKHQVKTIAAANPSLRHLVLIGDANDRSTDPKHFVPTEYVLSKATVKFGAEPEIATDNPFADLDDDKVPDLSLGRIPVDSPEELTQFIERVIRYESDVETAWQSRMNFIAGVGGFGRLVDSVVEEVAKKIITELVPDDIQTSMTYGSWTSPYCPNPEKFSQTAIERFNEGCLFWVYIGHGDRTRLDQVHLPDQSHLVLDKNSVRKIDCRSGNPIAIFLACYTNSFDGDEDCLGELMLKQDNGPIAVIGGSRVTMPAGMGLLSMALLNEYFGHSTTDEKENTLTLGEVFLNAKRELALGQKDFKGYRNLIESVATSLLPNQPFENERQDHVELMQLLGDPLLRIKKPGMIKMNAVQPDDDTIDVSGSIGRRTLPSANQKKPAPQTQIQIQICYQRDRLKNRFRRRRKYGSTAFSFSKYQEVYDQSRDLVCMQKMAMIDKDGRFETSFDLPAHVQGRCVVIGKASFDGRYFAGSAKIEIEKR